MKKYQLVAAVLGFLAVLLGAFGAHYMASQVSAERMGTWNTAVIYQMFHVLVVLAVCRADEFAGKWLASAVSCFFLGVMVFSGSLYLLVITEETWLGAITPIGGTLFLAGWVLLAVNFASIEEDNIG